MSLKRPLSPESNNYLIDNDIRQLKRLKLHSIIQDLRNEEANLVLLKKLRTSQQLLTRTNKNSTIKTNGFHSLPPSNTTTSLIKSHPLPTTNSFHQQRSIPTIPSKSSNSSLIINSNKISTNTSYEERKNQAKLALRKQLEIDLLNIPLPKPSLQDTVFIPNGTSLEFQPFIGLEDVMQCLNELQNDRQRLPQRFTDHAYINEPYICNQCGTDFTIRWWKHKNPKISNDIINILCDRCKKQITRRLSKTEHSNLLKNVFISAMEKEKEIEKNFHTLIKQEKNSSRLSSKSLITNTKQVQPLTPLSTYNSSINNQQNQIIKTKNFSTKLSQQTPSTLNLTRKSNVIIQSQTNHPSITHGNHLKTIKHNKTSMPIHHHQQQQQQQKHYHSLTNLPQQTKHNQFIKMQKNQMKQQTIIPSSRSVFPSNLNLSNSLSPSNFVKPTATKQRTFPTVQLK